ncbi:keratin-associated protein 13-1-like [Perognathus longimembris pacificus]|uniref:keratin-associated protein 13-1-like n=1 Tax=Perognathus longimembris pacificus TaxID=214514 RepID=UPI002018F712|nr:keratin-associated protein 13-1-like [Perognathus longimembris pacificus]
MSYSSCSGNFSSRSLRGCLPPSSSSCGSCFPSNLVYRTDHCAPSSCQLASSLHSGCQEVCGEPTGCQSSCVESSPCQSSCVDPRVSTFCSPCRTTYPGFLGFGSSACHPLGSGSRSCCSLGNGWRRSYSPFYTSRSCYPQGCGFSGFGSMGYGLYGFPSLSYGSRFCYPTSFPSRGFHSSCFQPFYQSGFY